MGSWLEQASQVTCIVITVCEVNKDQTNSLTKTEQHQNGE